jgi:hypothetical protein
MTYMGLFKLTMTSKVRWSPWWAQLSGSASRRPLRMTQGKKQTLAAATTNPSFPAYPLSMVALRSPGFRAWHRVPCPSARGGARGGLGVWRRVPVAALLWESGGRLLDVSRGTTSPPEADLRSWRPEMGQCWSLRVNLAHLMAKGRVWQVSASSASRRGMACIIGASSGGETHVSFSVRRPLR